MAIIDRTVVARFLWNFLLLFGALYLFGVAVDVVVSASRFLEAADQAVRQERAGSRAAAFALVLLDFHGPRVFQFFQFMVGMVCVGAMGFTFSQMHRTRELTALMAAGVNLRRPAMVLLAAALGLNLMQLANQEWILPRLAPRLVRGHSDLIQNRGTEFPVPLTRDGSGLLLQAASFDPPSGVLQGVVAIERDDRLQVRRRVAAPEARWDAVRNAWLLTDGVAMELPERPAASGEFTAVERPADALATTLGPEALLTRQFRLYGQMLSTPQLAALMESGGSDRSLGARLIASRIFSPLVNVLVLAAAVPFFLLREPRNLLQQSLRAAAFAVPVSITALTLTTVPISGLPPAVAAAIPAACLLPVAAYRLSALRS